MQSMVSELPFKEEKKNLAGGGGMGYREKKKRNKWEQICINKYSD